MKKKKPLRLKLTRETKEERKKRVSSGVKFRATAFESKRRKRLEKIHKKDWEE